MNPPRATAASLLLGFLLLLASPTTHALSDQRGIWFWQNTGSVYGSTYIIANPTLRANTIGWFLAHGIDRVYGSYGDFVGGGYIDEVIDWNTELNAAGIESHLLLDGAAEIFDDPVTPTAALASTLNKITVRFIDFNASQPAEAQFKAIHLDIEPQTLVEWDLFTEDDPDNPVDLELMLANRRDMYLKLRDTFDAIRAHLVSEGVGSTRLEADLNSWVDKITPSGHFKWESAVQRAQYFADLAASLDSISLMAYEIPVPATLANHVSWEIANITGMDVRVGLDAHVGPEKTWPTVSDFWGAADYLENEAYTPDIGIDLHSHKRIRELYSLTATATPILTATTVAVPLTGLHPGPSVYVGEKSSDLTGWESSGSSHPGAPHVTLEFPKEGPQGFFRAAAYGPDAPYKERAGFHPTITTTIPQYQIVATGATVALQITSPATTGGAKWPLVLFAADKGQAAGDTTHLVAHAASWGYACVVVSDPGDPQGDRTVPPANLSSLLDDILAGRIAPQQLAGRVDADRIAVMGHGTGSTTALKLAGLRYAEVGQAGTPIRRSDPRVKACIAISPEPVGHAGIYGADSWRAVTVPVLTASGSQDLTPGVAQASMRREAYEHLPRNRKAQLWLPDATHDDFTDTGIIRNGTERFARWYFQAIIAALDSWIGDDPAGLQWIRSQALNRLNRDGHEIDWNLGTAP